MPELVSSVGPVTGIQVVETFLDALKANDLERALVLLSEDVVYQNVPLPPDRGKQRVRRTLSLLMRVVTHFDVRMHHVAERDGVVLTERTDILRGPVLDLEFWVCGTFEVKNGKIVLWRDYFDLGGFMLQVVTSPLRKLLRVRA